MNRKPILTAAILLITALVAFQAGRITSSPQDETDRSENSADRASRSPRADGGTSQTSAREGRRSSATESLPQKLTRLDSIVRGENPYERSRALIAFLDRLAPDDFEKVVDHFRGLGITDERFGEYRLILAAWAKADPLAALAYAKAKTESRFAARTILATWATEDPVGALRWAQNNHQGESANPWLVGVIRGIAATDLEGASQLLKSMPRSVERGDALDALLPHLLAKGNESTRQWIASIEDDALRNGAVERAAEAMAESDPAGTVAWLMENPGETLDQRLDNIFSTWAKQNESAARLAINSLPSGEIRSDALRGVIRHFALSNPSEAVALMDQFPNEVDDNTVRSFVWHTFDNDPATALGEVSRIGDEDRRNEMYRRALGAWMRRDADAADTWLNANPVPESVMRSLAQ